MNRAKLDDSTQRPLYGERIIEESKIICFDNPNKKRIYEISIQLPCLLYTSPSPRDPKTSRMPSSA